MDSTSQISYSFLWLKPLLDIQNILHLTKVNKRFKESDLVKGKHLLERSMLLFIDAPSPKSYISRGHCLFTCN